MAGKEEKTARRLVLVVAVLAGVGAVGELLAALGAIAHPLVVVIPGVMILGPALWLVWRAMVPSRATRVVAKVLRLEDERPQLRRVSKRGSVWRLAWKMPVGTTAADLRAKLNALEEGLDCSASCWYERGLVWAELGTHRVPEVVGFGEFCERPGVDVEGMGLPIPVGESRVGRLWANLEALPHLLVGGTTGSGKTVFLRQLVTWFRHPLRRGSAAVGAHRPQGRHGVQHLPGSSAPALPGGERAGGLRDRVRARGPGDGSSAGDVRVGKRGEPVGVERDPRRWGAAVAGPGGGPMPSPGLCRHRGTTSAPRGCRQLDGYGRGGLGGRHSYRLSRNARRRSRAR